MSSPPRVDRVRAARAIEEFLRAIGRAPEDDPNLVGTGDRVASAYLDELCDGYDVDVAALLGDAVLTDSTTPPGELLVVRGLAVATVCPHHLLPATGEATVAFAPATRLVGLGTLAKLVDAYAHRLTLQETIGDLVARALVTHLGARWAGCRLLLAHGCFVARGERQHGARVETVGLAGALDGTTRALAYQALGVGLPPASHVAGSATMTGMDGSAVTAGTKGSASTAGIEGSASAEPSVPGRP